MIKGTGVTVGVVEAVAVGKGVEVGFGVFVAVGVRYTSSSGVPKQAKLANRRILRNKINFVFIVGDTHSCFCILLRAAPKYDKAYQNYPDC